MTRREDVAIISTSINERPADYAAWAEQGVLIVAGDLNTPPKLGAYVVEELGGIYLDPSFQERYAFSEALGWKCIQRRNAAVMYAYEQGFMYVLTVDDDNRPASDDFVDVHARFVRPGTELGDQEARVIGAVADEDRWVNTGDFLMPPTWQRGTPYGVDTAWSYVPSSGIDVVVSQAQALGSPDCDAVTRICHDPVAGVVRESVIVDPNTACIFNSQATMWRGALAPFIACLPGVGRYDDVLASLIAQRVFREANAAVRVGTPVALQDRNEHDLTKDLRGERWGMMNLPRIKRVIDDVYLRDEISVYDMYGRIAMVLMEHEVLPDQTTRFMAAWANEWRRIATFKLD